MAYTITEHRLGLTPIANTDAGAQINGAGVYLPPAAGAAKPGMIVRAVDPIYGEGEFVYLQGAASTVVGSVVTWSGVNGTTVQSYQTALAASNANLAQPLAVAMAANLANSWGWYQIGGNAVCATNGTLAAGPGPVYLAGSGQLTSTAAAGKQVENAVNVSATGTPGTNLAIVSIDRPHAQGAIT
jgi:hypothetical protein